MVTTLGFQWEVIFGMPQLVFVTGGAIAISAIVATQWRKVAQVREERQLKERLVERGFSADEIERVVSASTSASDDKD